MTEHTSQCPFVYEDGERCADFEGHEAYNMACGHLRPTKTEPEPTPVPHRLQRVASPLRSIAAIAVALSAGMMGSSRSPSRPRLEPMPLPISPEEEEERRMMRSSTYGRAGSQPLPRAFYSSRLMPGEDLVSTFDAAQKRARDEAALQAAKEKRERKAKKRRGG